MIRFLLCAGWFCFAAASGAQRDERAIEQEFRSIPSPDQERKQHRYFTAEPHPAGRNAITNSRNMWRGYGRSMAWRMFASIDTMS